jgi:hypothetical protein
VTILREKCVIRSVNTYRVCHVDMDGSWEPQVRVAFVCAAVLERGLSGDRLCPPDLYVHAASPTPAHAHAHAHAHEQMTSCTMHTV